MRDLAKERILITGGNGFLGRAVMRRLSLLGLEAMTPSRWDCDLTYKAHVFSMITEMAPTVVIHLAAYCGGIGKNQADPARMFEQNMQMGLHLFENCARYNRKLVTVGSVCAYPADTPVPFKEENLWNGYPEPTNAPYGIAKRALWTLLDAHHRQHGLKCAYLLPANLYGPNDHFDLEAGHVIPAMIRKFIETEGQPVELWGSGTPTRDFLYVDDCAEAIVRAAQYIETPEPINLGTGVETSMIQLADTLEALLGNGFGYFWNRSKPDGQKRRVLDTTEAKRRLEWEATTTLGRGLLKTINYYKSTQAAKCLL